MGSGGEVCGWGCGVLKLYLSCVCLGEYVVNRVNCDTLCGCRILEDKNECRV